MEKQGFFQQALADFTHEAASGGAIRHLADMGYTVGRIAEELDFPVPYREVQRAVWEHFINKGVILLEEPGSVSRKEKAVYVREYDKFGKASFRRVVKTEADEDGIVACWKELTVTHGEIPPERLFDLLWRKTEENGEGASYASWEFGLAAKREPNRYQAMLSVLNERQRQYISGLPWEDRKVYHKLDGRMMEILICLFGAGQYRGECYFPKIQEKVRLYGPNEG